MATLVTPPRVHGVRYHGLFAPHAKDHNRAVPATTSEPATTSYPGPDFGVADLIYSD